MTEQEERIEQMEKKIKILEMRVDYFYEEIRPNIMKDKHKHKPAVADKRLKHIEKIKGDKK